MLAGPSQASAAFGRQVLHHHMCSGTPRPEGPLAEGGRAVVEGGRAVVEGRRAVARAIGPARMATAA